MSIMDYTTLGSTGMEVSRLCLGCMSFGVQNDMHDWILDEDESREIIEQAIDLGINFFDTANAYSMGESEKILGNALADYDRDEQVVATKGFTHELLLRRRRATLERIGALTQNH